MAITVKHKFVSAIPDAGDTTIVQPSNWNDDHQLVGTVPVANGGTGASTLTGYVKGTGTTAMTAATTIPNTDITGLGTASTKDAGVANGVATLDSSGTVPLSQIPALGDLNYQGTWNATTNSPTLTSSVGTKGFYYVVSVAGTTNLNGITDWKVGDWAVFNGTAWQKIDNTDAVTSVNGYTGTVVLSYTDVGAFPATSTTGTGNVVLGTGSTQDNPTISNYENFTPTTAPSYSEGRIWYDSTQHTLAYYNDATNNLVHVGQEVQTKVINNTGSTITIGAPVYVTSTSSGQIYPNIALAQANSIATSSVLGLATQSIANGAVGYVTSYGILQPCNTGLFNVGDVLYLSPYTAGVLMNTVPPTGNAIIVGVVAYKNTPNGSIYVKQVSSYVVSAGTITGQVAVANGGTGASTLTGYVKGSGTSVMTASATIPTTDLSGTVTNAQLANSAITINGTSTSLGGSISVGTVTSVTGTAPVVSSGGTTPAISMAKATTSVDGYLSSTDWTTFNNKQPAGSYLTTVTSDAPLTGSGTSGSHLSMPAATTSVNGYLTSTDWNTFNGKSNTNGTVTSVAALTLGTTGTDLSSTVATGTTTPVITLQVPTASASNRGALSSTDWSTFNGKQAALVSGTNIKTVAGVSLLGSGDVGLIGGTYGGTGVNNGANTITVAGNLTHAGAFTQSFTATGNTAVTLPTSGTLISSATAPTNNPVTGTPSASNFLRGDGTWAIPSAGSATYGRTSFTATAGQTTFSVTYTAGYLQVYQNGAMLNGTDYTATNGTSVVLAIGASTGDIIETFAYATTTALTPAGSTTQVQYNNAGVLAGSANMTFDGTTLTANALTLTNALPLTSGGTGKTSASSANANLMGYTTTATAAGTTTLTNTSSYIQYFTGTSAQTIVMPVTSTLQTGWSFHIANNSTVAITLQSSGANTIGTIPPQTTAHITCIGTALTTAADWDFGYTDFGTLLGNDGAVPFQAQWYLSAAGSALTGATQNFFGANSAVSLDASSTYDIECYCYFLKTTSGTMQWIPTFSSAITVGHSYLEYTPVTGFTTTVITGAMVVGEATQQTTTVLTHTATAALTTAVYHIAKLRIRVTTNLACNFRLNGTISAGTITPQAGSWYTARKIATNSGTFVA